MDIGGNVLEAVLHNPAEFTVEHVVKFMLQVLEGLQQLHTRYHLVHTDLRGPYVYAGAVIPGLDKGFFRVRIGRLSRCKMLHKSSLDYEGRTTDSDPVPIDSLRWAPPEVLLAHAYYSHGSDIYSLGLMFWQLLYALQAVDQPDYRLVVPHPDWRLDRHEFHRKLMLGKHPEQPAQCPDWAYILIKMCLRSKFRRPTIDILQETLTHREPFRSTLLDGVRKQLSHSIDKPNINYTEQQATRAPYLGEYQEPLTSHSEPNCIKSQFEEPNHFYLRHARFGYQTEDEGEDCLLALSNKEDDDGVETDIYEYWDMYNDAITPYEQSYEQPYVTRDQTVRRFDQLEVKRLAYQNVYFDSEERPVMDYQNAPTYGGNGVEARNDIRLMQTSDARDQSEDHPSNPPMPGARLGCTSQQVLRHTELYRAPNAVSVSRSVSFIHDDINDEDSYSWVTKHFLQYPPGGLRDSQFSSEDKDYSSMV